MLCFALETRLFNYYFKGLPFNAKLFCARLTAILHASGTKTFSGTSAAAPLAAGILALTLQARPELYFDFYCYFTFDITINLRGLSYLVFVLFLASIIIFLMLLIIMILS